MLDVCKSKALRLKEIGGSLIGPRFGLARAGRWLPLTALLVIAGCSWFEEEPTPPEPSEQAKATPAPGEGETMNGDQEAQIPDINSVPNEAPKPSILNLDQAQQGLGADTSNAQHTDETLTMPNQSAARPVAPGQEEGTATAQVEPTAPEQAAPVTTEPTAPAPVSEPAPMSEPAPVAEPLPAPAPAPVMPAQVAQAGTPQPGSKPFEPSGPLSLAPGSLERNPEQMAAAGTAPTGMAATPMPTGQDGVSVDYSVLNGLQPGVPTGYPVVTGVAPMQGAAPSGGIAGVGQAVGYVYFGNGSSGLSAADRQVLQQVAQLQRIQGGVLRIIGHASARTGNMDALEQDQVNREVSLARATAVARALVQYGVQPILVQVAAAGDDQTLYAESTPAGEAGNRRAEVYLSQN